MNITSPTPNQIAEANEAVQHYKDVLKRGKSYSPEEDALMLATFKQVASGRAVVNALNLIRDGGVDDLQRPRLFLARASWKRVSWSSGTQGGGKFRDFAKTPWERGSRHIIYLPDGTLPNSKWTMNEWWSVVPSIPPLLRPRGRLDGYFILSEANWEANWSAVPADPALLRPIKWPLCAVLAVWDLTELERGS